MNSARRYFHTIRYLRPSQTFGRLWFKLRRVKPEFRATPQLRSALAKLAAPIAGQASLLGPDLFRFLNVERRCSSRSDWCARDVPRLWRYHLHYFDDLNASAAHERNLWHRNLLERWVVENPAGRGDGWEPYPVSRRIVNWIKWALRGNTLTPVVLESLAVQARWLSRKLEYHILGNHLFANAKALVYAGLFFDSTEAREWYENGISICAEQLKCQVLPDGGHFELSPMYHAAFVEDMLDMRNLHDVYGRQTDGQWVGICEKMRHWLCTMSHPDGEIAFFNDAAIGAAPNVADIEAYASRLGLPPLENDQCRSVFLQESSYVRVASHDVCLFCDCASIGPDYLPAHGHADALSFELSLNGERVFVNSGTSEYGAGEERQRQRGTAAHNTVVVDGQDSSEVWGGFRVARRARVTVHRIDLDEFGVVEASHDGYRRLRGSNTHLRRWVLRETSMCINDEIQGQYSRAEAFFHLHPAVDVRRTSSEGFILQPRSGRRLRLHFKNAESIQIDEASWHPEFGVSIKSQKIRVRLSRLPLLTQLDWGSP